MQYMKSAKHIKAAVLHSASLLSLAAAQAAALDAGSPGASDAQETFSRRVDRVMIEWGEETLAVYRQSAGKAGAVPSAGEIAGGSNHARSQAPVLRLAVSTTLSDHYKAEIRRDAGRTGVELVLIGLPVKKEFLTLDPYAADPAVKSRRTALLIEASRRAHEDFGSVSVDPHFFRRHEVAAVPCLVLEDGEGPLARVTGSVTMRWALERMLEMLADTTRVTNRLVGHKRIDAGREVLVEAGCRLVAGTLEEDFFAGYACGRAAGGASR